MKQAEPSVRAKKYIKNKVSGMSDYQAAVKAGYSHNTAIAAKQNIENPSVKESLRQLMDRKGLTDDRILDEVIDGIENSKRIVGSDDNFVEVPDYAVKHKYLETAIRLKGLNETEYSEEFFMAWRKK